MSGIIPIEYDADMDRFYIPVNSQYEIQTKGKGSSFRIANISTHERMLVADTYLHPMLEDMAKGCNAEYSQLHAQNTQLQLDNAKLCEALNYYSDAISIDDSQCECGRGTNTLDDGYKAREALATTSQAIGETE